MLLPRKENVTPAPIDIQRKRLPIYQAKPQLLNQLRQLHSAILIGEQLLAAQLASTVAPLSCQCATHEKEKKFTKCFHSAKNIFVGFNFFCKCHFKGLRLMS